MQFTFVLQTFYTEQIDEQQFIDVIHQAFGNRLTFFLFPYIICSIEEEVLQLALDKVYMQKLTSLPRKSACLLSKASSYGQLFIALIQDLETEMKLRIMQRQVVFVEKKPCIERQQLIQYIGILTRVKTRDMGRLKYLANLGLTMQNIWQVKHVVFLGHIQDERFKRFFQEFDNEQLQKIYIYAYICQSMINKKNVHEDVKFLSVNIYHKVVQKNPQLKALVKYSLGDEEYLVYQTNIYDTQKQIDKMRAKMEAERKKETKEVQVIDCLGQEGNQNIM